MIKYGKSFKPLMALKKNFFESNDTLVASQKKFDELYSQQPKRDVCKNCLQPLGQQPYMCRGEIPYFQCNVCGHLNGGFQDTDAYCQQIYLDSSADYASNYSEQSRDAYQQRVKSIYIPKADFLLESLKECSLDPANLTFADIGAGSGYFVQAMLDCGISKVCGYEVSSDQVAFGNQHLSKEALQHFNFSDTNELLRTINADVVSMIGVLEHLVNPSEALDAISQNPNIKYFYFLVPTLSMSTMLQPVFTGIFERALSYSHTHLYTEKSINWFADRYNMQIVSQWWFGADIFDLFRSVMVRMQQENQPQQLMDDWQGIMTELIDPMQLNLDMQKGSSEVHMLLAVNHDN